jgi:nitroimidazol reductase NimA-like FMN-containing flavoprotein (pyridoxamine 5'-phosphate oxidase superfamily)
MVFFAAFDGPARAIRALAQASGFLSDEFGQSPRSVFMGPTLLREGGIDMEPTEPTTELDAGFSSEGARPTEWAEAHQHLEEAEVFWLSTVRPDGRPHVTPLLAAWRADAMYFCTGSDERKAKNLELNPHCILTTGRNTLDENLDVVVEGQVAKVSDEAELEQVANTYESKYGTHLTAPEGTWFGLGDTIRRGEVLVCRVTPTTVLGFARGEQFSQTRWHFV